MQKLTGEKLPIPLPSGDTINIDRVTLDADGSQIKVDITKAAWLGLTWKPVIASVSFDQDKIDVRVAKAKLCGIDAPGMFSSAGGITAPLSGIIMPNAKSRGSRISTPMGIVWPRVPNMILLAYPSMVS